MSTTAVITKNNRAVKVNGVDQSNGQKSPYILEDLKFDIDGALIGFKVNSKEYFFIAKSNYFDVNKDKGKEGYCFKKCISRI